MSDDSMGAQLWDEHPGERLRDVIMLPRTRDDVEVAMFYESEERRIGKECTMKESSNGSCPIR